MDINSGPLRLAPNQGTIRGSDSAQHGIIAYRTNIKLAPYRVDCKHYDTIVDAFKSDKCYMTELTTLNYLHCRCTVAGAYTGSIENSSSLIYPMNFSITGKQIFDNPLAATLLVATWMVFIAMVRWARLLDKHDVEACKVTPLQDNSNRHTYLYLIGVNTGRSIRAGTTSNVYIYLKGSWDRSETHHLYDSSRQPFQKGAQNWFLLTTMDDIGDINSVVVWTDFSGAYPSWFLKNIIVKNLQTNESWNFQYNSWLSIAYGSRELVTEIPAYKERAASTTRIMQVHNMTKRHMQNDHLWLGLFTKTPTDRFTRVQRLTTGLTMLHTLMLLNLTFFRVFEIDVSGAERQHITILGQKIHLSSIFISLESAFIITILGLFLAFIFIRTKDKPAKKRSTNLTEEQQDMMMRQEDIISRKKQGLGKLYPFLTGSDFGSTLESGSSDEDSGAQTDKSANALLDRIFKRDIKLTEAELALIQAEKEAKKKEKSELKKWKEELVATKLISTRTFMLPWWSISLTWLAVIVLNVMFAYYIFQHGLKLLVEESLEWLLSFFLGIFFNVAIFIPILVLLSAAFRVLVLKKQQTRHEQGPISHIGAAKSVLYRLQVESEAREMIRDLILYTLFMATILIIINGHLNVNNEYKQKVSVENELLGLMSKEQLDEDEEGLLSEIRTVDQMWKYLIDVVAVKLIPEIDDLKNDMTRNFLLMGHARLRQVRSTTAQIDCFKGIPDIVWPRHQSHQCIQHLSKYQPEENRSFDVDWADLNNPNPDLLGNSVFRYHSAEKLKASAFFGEHGIYSGGGYIQLFLREDPGAIQNILQQLANSKWVDRFTRIMPRQYQHKAARGTFTKDAMEMVVAANLEGRSLRKAASDFGVNYKTLQRYVKLHQKDGNIEKANFGYSTQKKRIFSDEQEQALLDYIIEAS
ncbi:hypothetical protein RRG08_041817 [Elysia crispata]|uniref:PLAT domain-containing protein n=1 Tax=Elysia crispata TaxID=231223 RepID=A0AAE1CPI3_9GAST|nr:hypothetical protein RRG08_041817 [Elysia crispata]